MSNKGTFSDTKRTQSFDTFGSKALGEQQQWELEFIEGKPNGKDIETIGRVTIPMTMARVLARQIMAYPINQDELKPKENWRKHFESRKNNNEPSPLLMKAVSFLGDKLNFEALDIGSGNGIDAAYLVNKGYRVTAIDNSPIVGEYIKDLSEKLFFVNMSVEKYNFPNNRFGLVNAQWSLPYVVKGEFERVFKDVVRSLIDGGVFVGQFFGNKDDLIFSAPDMTFLSRLKVERVLSSLEVVELKEEEYEGKVGVTETRHTHVFQIIARKINK